MQNNITNNDGQPIEDEKNILYRMRSGEPIRLDDDQYPKIQTVVNRTIKLNAKLNISVN
jgi:transposase